MMTLTLCYSVSSKIILDKTKKKNKKRIAFISILFFCFVVENPQHVVKRTFRLTGLGLSNRTKRVSYINHSIFPHPFVYYRLYEMEFLFDG